MNVKIHHDLGGQHIWRTLLHEIIVARSEECLDLVLGFNPPLNAPDSAGYLPLKMALLLLKDKNYHLPADFYSDLGRRKRNVALSPLSRISVKLMNAGARVRSGAGSIFLTEDEMLLLQSKDAVAVERFPRPPTTMELPARTELVERYMNSRFSYSMITTVSQWMGQND